MDLIKRARRATENPWTLLVWSTVTSSSLAVAILFFGAPFEIYIPGLIFFSTIYLLFRSDRDFEEPRQRA